jgi:hypothetical protein
MSQIWNFVPTLLALVGILLAWWWLRRSLNLEDPNRDVRSLLGPLGLESVLIGLALMWILPWGLILILPIVFTLSFLSPAGREDWRTHKKARMTIAICVVVMVLLGGCVPVQQPVAPDAWGEPLLKENPNAPLYPTSEQYTWLMLPEEAGFEVEIVQTISMRIPYQYGTWGASASALDLAMFFGMESERMRQAIELLDQQTTGPSLDPDEMKMVQVNVPDKHSFLSTTQDVEEQVDVRVYELRSMLSTSEDGTRVGEVLCAAKAYAGGELQLLVVVRPVLHPSLSSDRYAESLVIEWLASAND